MFRHPTRLIDRRSVKLFLLKKNMAERNTAAVGSRPAARGLDITETHGIWMTKQDALAGTRNFAVNQT
jgi:hypothetical protein